MSGHHRHANETPFKWRFAGVPMYVPLIVLIGFCHKKKKLCKVGPRLAKLSGSAHVTYVSERLHCKKIIPFEFGTYAR